MNSRSKVIEYFNRDPSTLSGHFTQSSEVTGPRIIVVGGTHGNEPAGVEAMYQISQFFKSGLSLVRGKVDFIIGNPEAYLEDVRYIDFDLNRAFYSKSGCFGHEENRAHELRDYLLNSGEYDFLIDLHSVSRGDEKIVIHRRDQTSTETLIKSLDFDYHELIYSKEYLEGLLIDIGYSTGANAIAVECGNHNNSSAYKVGSKIILKSLLKYEMISRDDFNSFTDEVNCQHEIKKRYRFVIFDRIIPKSDNFKFVFSEDETIITLMEGQIYAESDGDILKAESDCFLMMPAKNVKKSDCDVGFFCTRHPIL